MGSAPGASFKRYSTTRTTNGVALLPAVLGGGINAAEIGAVRQALVDLQTRILAHSPEQVRPSFRGRPPEFETGEETVRQAQHPFPQSGHNIPGKCDLIGGIVGHACIPENMRSVFQQCHKADFGERTGSATGARVSESLIVFDGVGHVQGAAVQTNLTAIVYTRRPGCGSLQWARPRFRTKSLAVQHPDDCGPGRSPTCLLP